MVHEALASSSGVKIYSILNMKPSTFVSTSMRKGPATNTSKNKARECSLHAVTRSAVHGSKQLGREDEDVQDDVLPAKKRGPSKKRVAIDRGNKKRNDAPGTASNHRIVPPDVARMFEAATWLACGALVDEADLPETLELTSTEVVGAHKARLARHLGDMPQTVANHPHFLPLLLAHKEEGRGSTSTASSRVHIFAGVGHLTGRPHSTSYHSTEARAIPLSPTNTRSDDTRYGIRRGRAGTENVHKLLACGVELDEIESIFVQAMAAHGHTAAARGFVEELRLNHDIEHIHVAHQSSDTAIYARVRIGTTADGRVENDDEHISVRRRYLNLLWSVQDADQSDSLTGDPSTRPRAYRIPSLEVVIANVLALRTDARISATESTIIDALGGMGLNSMRGGTGCEFEPSASTRQVIDAAFDAAGLHDVGTDQNPALVEDARVLSDEEDHYFDERVESIAPCALESANVADCVRQIGDRVVGYEFHKCITYENLSGAVGGLRDEEIGRGMCEDRHALQLLNPGMPLRGKFCVEDIARFTGTSADLRRVTVGKRDPYLHRLLCVPLFMMLDAAFIVSYILQTDLLPEACAAGVAHQSALLASLEGTIVIVRYGPDTDICLHVSLPDSGDFKWNARFASLCAELLFLGQAIAEAVAR
ncbi:hypothetical protein PLICRDRAFT_176072 [Plicaturopsis crispa FD-325 SS-3]|nr:hypothetical protein PLICRDRAFT_176072 [Plicaturopsis crispa FD-325 SS-3]